MATNIRVGVQLETDAAKQQIADLTASLKNIGKINFDTGFIKSELLEADRAAQQLQTHLNAAVDVKTGNLNLAAFQKSLQTAGTDLGTLLTKIQAAGPAGQQAFGQLATAIATARAPIKQLHGALGSMWTTLKNTAKWQLSSSMIHGFMSAIQGATTYAKELNSALTDIRIVTGQSIDQMTKFTEKAHQAAQALSTSTKEYAKASLIYYQQGLSDSDVEKRAALTVKAANASFESNTKEMSQMLTAVWNSYQAGADQLQSYVDVMASLGATTASSMEEIATAMQKVASTANMVGVSMQQMSSIIATVADTTRTAPEQIGTAYKTILARIGDLKLGETLEDGVGLGTVSTSLKKIGVDLLDATGELREMGTVIEEIGQKWQTMNKAQQTALAQQLGGKRQYTTLVALFENIDKYYKNMETAANSNGALDKMQETYASGWEAASTRVKTAIEGIYHQLIDDQAIIHITDGFSGFLNLINDLVKGMGGLNGVLSAMGSIVTGIFADKAFASIRQLGTDLKTIFSNPVNTTAAMLRDNAEDLKKSASQDPNATRSEITKQTAELATSRALMLEKSKMMTETERTQSESQLNQISTMIQKTNELGAAYEENSKRADVAGQKLSASLGDISSQMKSMKSTISGGGTQASGLLDLLVGDASKSDQWMASTDNVLLAWRKLQDIEQAGQSAIRLSLELDNYQDADDKITRMKVAIESLQKATAGTKIDLSSLINLDENSLKNMSGKDFAAAINKIFNGMDMSQITKLNNVFTNIFDGIIAKANDPKISQMWEAFKDGAQLSSEQLDALATHLGMTREELEKYKASLKDLGTSLGDRLTSGIMKAASGMMALNSTMNATNTFVKNAYQGTLNFANGFSSVSTTLLMGARSVLMFKESLTTMFKSMSAASAGWIGLAITALTTIISAVSTAQSEAQKIAYEAYAENEKARQELAKENAESTSEYAKLVATFSALYDEYSRTGEVTDTFADAAKNLAENLDDSVAKLLLLSGQYEAFMDYIKGTSKQKVTDNAKTFREDLETLTTDKIQFTKEDNKFPGSTTISNGENFQGNVVTQLNTVNAAHDTTGEFWYFTDARGTKYEASHYTPKDAGVLPRMVDYGDSNEVLPFVYMPGTGTYDGRAKGTIKFQGIKSEEWEAMSTLLTNPKYESLIPYFLHANDDIFINTEDLFSTLENLELFDEFVTDITDLKLSGGSTLGKNLKEMRTQYTPRLERLVSDRDAIKSSMESLWSGKLLGLDDESFDSWEAWSNWANTNIFSGQDWEDYVELVHNGDEQAARLAFSSTPAIATQTGTNFQKWNAVSAMSNGTRSYSTPSTLLNDKWTKIFQTAGGVNSKLTAADALMLNAIDPDLPENAALVRAYTQQFSRPSGTTQEAITAHGTAMESVTGWSKAKTISAKQALLDSSIGTSVAEGGFAVTEENDTLAQGVLNTQALATAITQSTEQTAAYNTTKAAIANTAKREKGATLPTISRYYSKQFAETEIPITGYSNGEKWESKFTPQAASQEYMDFSQLMNLDNGLIEKNDDGEYVLTEKGKLWADTNHINAAGYLKNINAHEGVGDSLTSGAITAPEEFLRYSPTLGIAMAMTAYAKAPEKYNKIGAAVGYIMSGGNGKYLTADNKDAVAAMKEQTRLRNGALIAGASTASGLNGLPTSDEDWANLYSAYGDYMNGETISEFMTLTQSGLGTRLRTRANADKAVTTDLKQGSYVSYSTLLDMMAKEQAGDQDVDKWLASEEGQQWLATQDVDSLYAYALDHGFSGDILTDNEAVARAKANASVLTSAFDLENNETINKLSQVQGLVSAITTDLSNMRSGQSLSQNTKNLLELMGINPDSINTVEELEQVLTDLNDPNKANSVPSLIATLEESAKTNYGLDFSSVTQKDIDAWSAEGASEDDKRKLALYKEWLEYKNQEYQLDQQIEAIEKTNRDNREQSKLNKWTEELTELNKEVEKAKTNYENLASAIETGHLTQSQRSTLGKSLADDWDAATTAADRAKVAMQAAYQSTAKQQEALDQQMAAITKFSAKDEAGKRVYGGKAWYHDTDQNGHELHRKIANWQDESSFIENVFGKNLSAAETSVLSTAYQATVKLVPEWATTPDVFMETFWQELDKAMADYGEQSDELMAQLADNVNSLYSNLGEKEQAAAAKMVAAWTTAFQQIKTIRQTILSGGDQMEMIAGSPEKAIAAWAMYAKANVGATTTSFLTAAAGNNLNVDNYKYDTVTATSYVEAAKRAYGLSYIPTKGENGYDTETMYKNLATDTLGLTYQEGAKGKWKWHPGENGQAGYFTQGDDTETHYSLSDMKNQPVNAEAMASYIQPFLVAGLTQAESAGTLDLGEYESMDALIADALFNNTEGAWDLINSNLANVNGGLEAYAHACKIAATSTEALAKAQKDAKDEVENQYDIGKNASSQSKIASALAAYAADTSGQDWATFALGQGLTPAEIAAAGTGITHGNASQKARGRYKTTAGLYDAAAGKVWDNMSSYLTEVAEGETGDLTIDGKSYKIKTDAEGNPLISRTALDQMMVERANYQQQAASARGSQQQEMDAETQRLYERQNARYQAVDNMKANKVSAENALRNNAENFYRTGIIDADTREALKAAGINPDNITTWDQYKTQMKALKNAKQEKADQEKFMLRASASQSGLRLEDTAFAGFEDKSFIEWIDQWDSNSEMYKWAVTQESAFTSWQKAARSAQEAQTDLTADAIEMGVKIQNAMKAATKETTRLTKEYNKISGLSNSLSSKLEKGGIDEKLRNQLSSAGLLDSWNSKITAAGRAEIMMQARGVEAVRQATLTRQQNAAIFGWGTDKGYGEFFGRGAADGAADSMKQRFIDKWNTDGTNKGDLDTWFQNLISEDAFKNLSSEAKNALEEIWSNLDISSEDSPEQIWTKFITACQEAEDIAKEAIAEITESMLTDWNSALSGIISATQAAAAEVVAIWQAAFEVLAKMYQDAFSGNPLGESLESVEDYATAARLLGVTSLADLDKKLHQRDAEAQASVEGAELPSLSGKQASVSANGLLEYATYTPDESTFSANITNGETLKNAILNNEAFKALDVTAYLDTLDDNALKELGVTKTDTGYSYNGKEVTGSAADFFSNWTAEDWDNLFWTGLGAQQKYREDAREQNATQIEERMTGGTLQQPIYLHDGTEVKTLSEMTRKYNEQWQEDDADLLATAAGANGVGKWKPTDQGGIFTPEQWERLEALGVHNADEAIAMKNAYNADTRLLAENQKATAQAARAAVQAVTGEDNQEHQVDTSTAKEWQEGMVLQPGQVKYKAMGEDDKEHTYVADELMPEQVEALDTKLEELETQADNTTTALTSGFTDALKASADALDVEIDMLGQTVEDIAALEGVTLDWSAMNEQEQVMAARMAEEWTKATEALKTLGDALKDKTGAFAVIEDETKSISEQKAAYETLRDAVNNYFRDAEVGIDFVKANKDLIKEWAEGSEEAMEQLEAKVLEQQLSDMFKKAGKSMDDAGDALSRLNKLGNGLKFGQSIGREGVKAFRDLQKELGLTNDQMKALADTMGFTMEETMTSGTANDLVAAMGLDGAVEYAKSLGLELRESAEGGYEFAEATEGALDAAQESAANLPDIGDVLGDQSYEITPEVQEPEIPEVPDQTVQYHGEGYDVEFSEATGQGEGTQESEATAVTTTVDGKVFTTQAEGEGSNSQEVKVPIPVFTDAKSTRPSGTPQKQSGGGGGGGKKKQKAKSKADIKRYHEVDKSIDTYDSKMNKLKSKEEMAFGADRVKLMTERMKDLNAQMDNYQEKLNEAAAYEKKDKANLEAAGAELGFTFTYDEDGNITNWEQWQEELIDWYNEHRDDEAEDGMESAEDIYKRLTQISEDYEDSVATRQEMEEKMLELLHEQSELYADIIQESHQWKLDLQDLDLDLLEGQLNRMDDTLSNMGDKAKLMAEALMGEDGVGLDGTSMQKLDELIALQNDIAAAKTDEASIKAGEGMDEATKAEKLQEVMGQIDEQMNDLWSKGQEIQQLYGEMWSKYDEQLQANAALINQNISATESLVKILELAGRSEDFGKLDEYYRKQLDYANKSVDLYMSNREAIAAEKARFDQEIKDAGGIDNLDEQRKQDYMDLVARLQEADANLMDATQQVLEAAAAVYQNAVNKSIKELDSALSMGMDDLDYLQQQYDRYTETQERYLNTAHQLYNVNKLNRQIEGAMADTNSKALRDQYEALQNVINEKSKSGKLTQYDVDMMQKQYELLEKQAALRDAQNAKDTVRLTRDENGNYMYQYTADQDKIDEAMQDYNDVLIEINELSTERVTELEQQMLEKRKWYVEQARAIAEDETLTEEQKQQRLTELRQQAAEDDMYFQEQMGIAYENLQINNSACVAAFGDAVDQAYNDPTEGINPTIQAAIANDENMADALGKAIDEIIPKLQELGRVQDQTLNRTGLEDPDKYFESMQESTQLAVSETAKLNETLATEAEQINAVTQEWYNQKKVLKDLFDTIEAANTENLQLLWKLGTNDSEIADPSSTGTIQYHLVPVRSSTTNSTEGYATGGLNDYTGYAWLDGTPSKPELVLNAIDTANMLQTVDMLHSIDVNAVQSLLGLLAGLASAMSGGGISAGAANIFTGSGAMEQDVHITAEFPNATDKNEIMAAFDELNNRASQFINKNR